MDKTEIAQALAKRPSELTKEQLCELFSVFFFDIKEYDLKKNDLYFEIHFKRTYLIQVVYPVVNGMMSFRNDFINFSDGCHGVSMQRAKDTGELLRVFINMFYQNLLADAGYECYFDEENSQYASKEEAQEALEYIQSLL